jgi:hypothetical protein
MLRRTLPLNYGYQKARCAEGFSMKVSEQDLRERYEGMESEQLLELHTRGSLTEAARRVLEQVLVERSVSAEKRASLESEIKQRAAARDEEIASLASLGERLGAQCIDFVVVVVILLLAFLFFPVVHRHTRNPCSYTQSFVRNLLLSLLGIIDWLFIFPRPHQRLGDILANTNVVRQGPPSRP